MATLEERVAALEQQFVKFHDQTVADIHVIEENTTILLGVIRHQGQDIRRIFERLATMDERLAGIEQRQETMDRYLGRLETKLDEHTSLLTQILERISR